MGVGSHYLSFDKLHSCRGKGFFFFFQLIAILLQATTSLLTLCSFKNKVRCSKISNSQDFSTVVELQDQLNYKFSSCKVKFTGTAAGSDCFVRVV